MSRDENARFPVDLSPLTVASEVVAAPDDMVSPDSIAHDGATFFGELDLMDLAGLTDVKRRHGPVGVPRAYAIRSDGSGNLSFVFAPAPSETFSLRASYFSGITAGNRLNATNASNRMLLAHPDIYLYAALVESAPHLMADERLVVWDSMLNQRLAELAILTQNQQFGGSLSQPPRRHF